MSRATAERRPARSSVGYWLRENIRQIVSALVVVLFVRVYFVEIFKIPTGSMAATLYGVHTRVVCKRCQWTYVVGAPKGEVDAAFLARSVECPSCNQANTLSDFACHGGHKIIANKWIYRLRDPRRWEVVVFRFYDGEGKPVNYIKRLVGLPGDRGLSIQHGDLYVDGKLQAKPAAVQDAVWVPVYDSDFQNGWKPAWSLTGGVEPDARVWRFPAAPGRMTWEGAIRNLLVYNHGDSGSTYKEVHSVGDLRVRLEVRPAAADPVVSVGIREDDYEYVSRLSANPQGSFLAVRCKGKEVRRWPLAVKIATDRATRIDFSNADDRVRLSLDGKPVSDQVFQASVALGQEPGSGVWIEGGGGLEARRVRIDRDIYYTSEPGGNLFPFDVPEGGYFFLGDNSNNSNDSRTWNDGRHQQVHTVGRDRILGKASYDLLYVEIDWPWRLPWGEIRVGGVR